ncbi:MAG TPA: hypothetical protein VIV40_26765 [Kofleriaceae bacterium]
MGIGSPRHAPVARRPFPYVFAFSLPVLGVLDVVALRALGQGWLLAGGGGVLAAVIGALFAFTLLGGFSSFELGYYGWKRAILLGVVTALCVGVIELVADWPFIAVLAAGLAAALFALMLLMKATGDL